MNLTSTNHALELVTSAADSIDFTADFTIIDKTAATDVTPGSNDGNITGATTTTLVSAPAADTYKIVRGVTVRNTGTIDNTVTLQKDVGGTNIPIASVVLAVDESFVLDETGAVTVYNSMGVPKNGVVFVPASSVMMAPHFASASITGTKTISTLSSFAVYVGKAPRALTSAILRCRVTTAMATITWGEVALAVGSINVGSDPTLTVVGYTDVSGQFNSLGQKSVTINVAAGQAINEGDDLWVLIGNQATTACIVRSQSIADDIQVGLQASFAVRPSTIVGTPTAFTIEGASTVAAWVALIV
jgi:hypothetical protein